MALTRETIVANAALATLTDEQIKALTSLSENDENVVIGKRIGEVYTEMDKKVKEITGVERNGDEKTYLYLARATTADEVGTFKTQVDNLTKEKVRLEKAITDGSTDVETKKALEQAKKDLSSVTNQYNTLKTEHDTTKETHNKELFGVKIGNELALATTGLKFKSEYPEAVTKVLLDQALGKIKGMNPDFIDDGKGGKQLAFKDETGAIMRNKENQLNPFTASELVQQELKTMGVLDEGRKAAGSGTGGGAGGEGGKGGIVIDVKSAKTQLEATNAINASLMEQGLAKGSEAYQTALNAAWTDNGVADLPTQ
jgi:hypothetical protein